MRSSSVAELLELAQIVLSSTRELGQTHVTTDEMRPLMVGWSMHRAVGPNGAGGAGGPALSSVRQSGASDRATLGPGRSGSTAWSLTSRSTSLKDGGGRAREPRPGSPGT